MPVSYTHLHLITSRFYYKFNLAWLKGNESIIDVYKRQKKYYEALLADPGNAQFHLTDPRGASDKSGRTFNNPYQ